MKSDSAIPGMICLLILASCVGMLTCCAEYPVSVSISSQYGKITHSAKGGLEIIVEK